MIEAIPPPEPPREEIVVVGRALPDARGEMAYAVEVLDRADLIDAPYTRLDSILLQLPGLQLFRRSDSTSGHPTSQGVTMRSLGGNASSRALLLLDGVPQTDPFGGWVNWPAYDPASLADVRVVRGGGSVAHGPGALAGVIEMRSLTEPGANASLEAGSRNSVRGRGYFAGVAASGLVTINAHAGKGSGFIPLTSATRGPIDRSAPYEEGNLRLRWIRPVAGGVELQANVLGFVDRRERGVPFTGNRTRGADASLRIVGSGRWQWSVASYAQWRNFRSSFASVNDERTAAERVALQDSVPSQGFGGSIEVRPPLGEDFELRLGADLRFTSGESRELYAFSAGAPSRRRAAGGDTATQGAFGEITWTGGTLTLTGGARLDYWRISDGKLVERLLATGITTRDDRFPSRSGWRSTARAAALIDAGSGLKLRSAAYLGWRMPTLNELFRPFRVGSDATAANPFLEPERLSGAELSLSYSRGAIDLSLTGFVNRLSGAIANVTLDQGPGIFPGVGFVAGNYLQRQNLRAVNVRGIEASGVLRQGPWSLRLGGSFSDAEVDAAGAASALDGLRPAQTPRVVVSGELGWSNGRRTASLFVRHTGSQFEDDLNRQKLRPATSVDAFVAWPLARRLQLFARGENLLNETIIAGIGDNGTVERATPRTISIGVRLEHF